MHDEISLNREKKNNNKQSLEHIDIKGIKLNVVNIFYENQKQLIYIITIINGPF
jgi:hypothetical protein